MKTPNLPKLMTKEEIKKAVAQQREIKKKYPEFWTMHMILFQLQGFDPNELKEMPSSNERVSKL